MGNNLLRLACLTLVLARAGSATAQEDTVRSKQLYKQGQDAFAAGRFKEAIGKFDLAFAESPRPRLLWNVAQSYRRQYQVDHDPAGLRKAHLVLRSYLDMVQSDAERKEALEADEQVQAQAALLESTARPAPVLVEQPRGSRAPGIGVAAVGVGVAGLGVAFGLLARAAGSKVHNAGTAMDPVPFASIADDESRGRTYGTLAIVCYAVGAAAVVAGVVLLIVRPGGHARASAFLAPSAGGAQVVGQW